MSHKGAIAAILGSREGLDYTSITCLDFDGQALFPIRVGLRPHPTLTDPICHALLEAAGAGEKLQAHCRAVAELAEEYLFTKREHTVTAEAMLVDRMVRDGCRAKDAIRLVLQDENNSYSKNELYAASLRLKELFG